MDLDSNGAPKLTTTSGLIVSHAKWLNAQPRIHRSVATMADGDRPSPLVESPVITDSWPQTLSVSMDKDCG